ncbi:coiled-coil domain-containing protein 167 isoform X2 [Candoia aspera]|uniref:coiled-coil domain-containing protein 167 isoform X2 n=1 Tax=Candoia aspera TaxID=51853 RepID=UPI002FD80ED6
MRVGAKQLLESHPLPIVELLDNSVSKRNWVESLEDKLTLCRQALEEVDFKLCREELTSARRESLEKEKNLLETKAEIYEKELKMLRHENRKTVALSAAIILLVFIIYTCWTM